MYPLERQTSGVVGTPASAGVLLTSSREVIVQERLVAKGLSGDVLQLPAFPETPVYQRRDTLEHADATICLTHSEVGGAYR